MVTIKWCLNQKNGLETVEPNENMSNSYINMAEESIKALKNIQQSNIWKTTMSYYICYYSLYSLMIRIGIKCEIHACSLEFMRKHLKHFYDEIDIKLINNAFQARIDLQYYSDRPVNQKIINEIAEGCTDFFIKTKDILASITEKQIEQIRTNIKKESE